MANIIKLPQYIWFEPDEVEFPLPDSWQVTVHNIAGYNRPVIKSDEIKAAIASPIGMLPLRELAKDRKEVAIIFDDMTRSTPVSEIAPLVLEELAEAGVTDDRIRFISGVANHHALDRISMVKKLGEDIVSRFPVYNHCPFLNCTYVGTTSYGAKASINSEVMSCDLKIAIGQVLPHPLYGLSGGGKMIMPGVASYDTVANHHGKTHQDWQTKQRQLGKPVIGTIADSPVHAEAMEIAEMAGLDMVINCITNGFGEISAIFAGALKPTYQKAVNEARVHYANTNTKDSDIVIANNFMKASEFNMALSSIQALKPEGGSFVLIASSPSGQVVHYLIDRFGKTIGGILSRQMPVPPHIKKLIIYNEYPEAKIMRGFSNPEKVLQTSDWKEVIDSLTEVQGENAKVAVYPNADTQFFT